MKCCCVLCETGSNWLGTHGPRCTTAVLLFNQNSCRVGKSAVFAERDFAWLRAIVRTSWACTHQPDVTGKPHISVGRSRVLNIQTDTFLKAKELFFLSFGPTCPSSHHTHAPQFSLLLALIQSFRGICTEDPEISTSNLASQCSLSDMYQREGGRGRHRQTVFHPVWKTDSPPPPPPPNWVVPREISRGITPRAVSRLLHQKA